MRVSAAASLTRPLHVVAPVAEAITALLESHWTGRFPVNGVTSMLEPSQIIHGVARLLDAQPVRGDLLEAVHSPDNRNR